MKIVLPILLLFITQTILSQSIKDLNCENGFKTIKTELEFEPVVSYKIIYSQKFYGEESFGFNQGLVLIDEINEEITSSELSEILARIAVKNNMTKLILLSNCEAGELFLQQPGLSFEQNKFLNDNIIADLDIDLQNSLSKKEKRNHKRKRDFVESVSQEACSKFEELNSEHISSEKYSEIVSSILAEHTRKAVKIYKLPFEQSSDQFIMDVSNRLISNCMMLKNMVEN